MPRSVFWPFTGKGKTVSQIGWKLPYELFMRSRKQGNSDTEDEGPEPVRNIQTLEIGEKLYPVMASVKDGVTAPPKHYTDVIHFESRQWKYSKCKGAG